MVPSMGIPSRIAAPTLLVPENPAMYDALAMPNAASFPWVRRALKSATIRSPAASITRAALVASIDSKFTRLMSAVSTAGTG